MRGKMDSKTFIELIGYTGSLLVIVSMLMTSLIKLRIINTVGSVIFATYALIIHSYPTAVMQFFLILINVISLHKLFKSKKDFSVIKVSFQDSFFLHFYRTYKDDMKKFFPNIDFDSCGGDLHSLHEDAHSCEGKLSATKDVHSCEGKLSATEVAIPCESERHSESEFDLSQSEIYLVCCGTVPAGILFAKRISDDEIMVKVDYATPSYRDCSVGKYLYSYLAAQGIKKIQIQNVEKSHLKYLRKMGFSEIGGTYVKNLSPQI